MSRVAVLTAIADPRREADVVAALAGDGPVRVTRRCVDVADLLSAAAAGIATVAVVSADLRRLDREVLTRLAACGVAVVALVSDGDEAGERRLRQLGIGHVVAGSASAADVAGAVLAATAQPVHAPEFAYAGGWAPAPDLPGPRSAAATEDDDAPGRVVAVWGPTGAPGRSTVAVTVAAELAHLGVRCLLVDADVYGGAVAQLLGLLDEAPGLAAACRLANNGTLDVIGLSELAVQVTPRLRVLTGVTRADRWPELRPSALEVVLDLARRLDEVVVVDCSFSLERDEELSFDTMAPRRNGATLTVLTAADTVLAVAGADPVGLQRFVRARGELAELLPDADVRTVVNRTRDSAVGGGSAAQEIGAALQRFAGITDPRFVPLDVAGCDAAVSVGRTLTEAAPRSAARLALRAVAQDISGQPVYARRNRLRGRRS
jgi:MinD-like ATPase involved in chromosome partitioning or flagellar assembly